MPIRILQVIFKIIILSIIIVVEIAQRIILSYSPNSQSRSVRNIHIAEVSEITSLQMTPHCIAQTTFIVSYMYLQVLHGNDFVKRYFCGTIQKKFSLIEWHNSMQVALNLQHSMSCFQHKVFQQTLYFLVGVWKPFMLGEN